MNSQQAQIIPPTSRTYTFKVYFNDEIRKFSITKKDDGSFPSFHEFTNQLAKLFVNDKYHKEMKYRYVDESDDAITFSTALEWNSAIGYFKTLNPIKITVLTKEKPSSNFRNSAAPCPIRCYTKQNKNKNKNKDEKKKSTTTTSDTSPKNSNSNSNSNNPFGNITPEDIQQLAQAVPQCIASYFENGKILPHHLPDWLNDIVQISPVFSENGNNTGDVDLDVNVTALISSLNSQAYYAMEDHKYAEAERLLLDVLAIDAKNKLALYNLACVYSINYETDRALTYIEKAVDAGYSKWEHMLRDDDLANIWPTERFAKLIEKMSGRQHVSPIF